MEINFFCEKIDFELENSNKLINWITLAANKEEKQIGDLNIIFTNEEEILRINKEYLDHDYYTDIITFDYSINDILSGDIFISIPTITSNACKYKVPFISELNRIIIHGVLHLIGYKDKSDEDKKEMTSKEDYYLSLL